MHVPKERLLNLSVYGVTVAAIASFGFAGTAAADSIHLTGPGSVNIISSGYDGDDNDHNNKYKNASWKNNDHNGYGGNHHKSGGYGYMSDWRDWCEDNYKKLYSWNNNDYGWKNDKHHKDDDHKKKYAKHHDKRDWKPVSWKKEYAHHDKKWDDKKDHKWEDKKDDHKDYDRDYHHDNNYGNRYEKSYSNDVDVNVVNNVDVDNETRQYATSGDVDAKYNTRVGHVSSGDAKNVTSTTTRVDLDNRGAYSNLGGGQHDNNGYEQASYGGHGSYDRYSSDYSNEYDVDIENDVDIDNKTVQYATSGDVDVKGNTYAGDIRSGDASNHSTTRTVVAIRN